MVLRFSGEHMVTRRSESCSDGSIKVFLIYSMSFSVFSETTGTTTGRLRFDVASTRPTPPASCATMVPPATEPKPTPDARLPASLLAKGLRKELGLGTDTTILFRGDKDWERCEVTTLEDDISAVLPANEPSSRPRLLSEFRSASNCDTEDVAFSGTLWSLLRLLGLGLLLSGLSICSSSSAEFLAYLVLSSVPTVHASLAFSRTSVKLLATLTSSTVCSSMLVWKDA
mmetsp:Transcript_1792/g.2859  ORF Transcript_1792/g.2859 Transcript_1792/m.2859 type:complete len:228 (+) Transcript_1792:41-724(+)